MRHRSDIDLSKVLPSAAASVGAPSFHDDLGIGASTTVIVCLVDGLGATLLERHPELFDALRDAEGGSIEASFPTTTPTGLATLGTGLLPGQHGIVGASFWLPEDNRVLSPLHWGRQPTPQAVQPEATVFERARKAGVNTLTVAPTAYMNSGLTLAALRGSDYRAADSSEERATVLADALGDGVPTLAYVYWSALDRAAHEFGTDSRQWHQAAQGVNDLLWQLRNELVEGSALIVTADHGMVDCRERIWFEDVPQLAVGVRALAGEPRMRHVYTHPDHDPADVASRWQEALGVKAMVMTREEAIEQGFFGVVDPVIVDRIGDVLAIAQGEAIVASRRFDERVSNLRGHHGGRSEDERRIPAMILRG